MNRIFYLDLLRVLACFMVICMHAPMAPNLSGEIPVAIRAFMVYSSYLTLPCVCLFFAVSGALLLPVKTQPHESGIWLKKRIKKVITPTIIWTALYLLTFHNLDSGTELLRQICSIPFNRQGHGILWFIYTLVGLYFVSPIISPWLERCGKKTLGLYLGLWSITLIYPILKGFLDINETQYGILYYFSGFVGYFVLGYYLHNYGVKGKTWFYIVLLICLMPLLLLYKVFVEGKYPIDGEIMWYLGIVCLLMLICWWKIMGTIADKLERNKFVVTSITLVSNLSFGVYLCHVFVMQKCVYKVTCMITNYYLQSFSTIFLTFIITIMVSYLISLLPLGDYIIGYKRSRK